MMFLPKIYVQKMGPQIAKRLVLQIRNPQIVQFAEGPLILEIGKSSQVCGFAIYETYLRTAHL
jgi:hypothetical protein